MDTSKTEALDLTVTRSPDIKASPDCSLQSPFNFPSPSFPKPPSAHQQPSTSPLNTDSDQMQEFKLLPDTPSVSLISMIKARPTTYSPTRSTNITNQIYYMCNMCNHISERICTVMDHLLTEHSEITNGTGFAMAEPNDLPIDATISKNDALYSLQDNNTSPIMDSFNSQRFTLHPVIKCPSCNKGFYSQTALQRHQKMHDDSAACHCPICKTGFSELHDYHAHMAEIHRMHVDDYCLNQMSPPSNESMTSITSTTQENSNISRANSVTSSPSSTGLPSPYASLPNRNSSDIQPADLSQQSPDSSMDNDQIIQLQNAPGSNDRRTLNAKVNSLKHDGTTDLIQSLEPKQASDGRIYFKCHQCNLTTSSQAAMKLHLQDHNECRPHRCKLCGYEAKTKPQLKVHLMRHTGKKSFHCSICNYSCVTHSDLNRHCKSRTHVFREALQKSKT